MGETVGSLVKAVRDEDAKIHIDIGARIKVGRSSAV